jgi:hypothetical protein
LPIIYPMCPITRVTRGRDPKTVPQKRRQVLTNSPKGDRFRVRWDRPKEE